MGHSATPTVPPTGSKRLRNSTVLISDDSDEETPEKQQTTRSKQRKKKSIQEEKLERIDDLIDQLKEKHDTMYNAMQYRIWAETIDLGRHSSLEMKPKESISNRREKRILILEEVLHLLKLPTCVQHTFSKDFHSLKEAGAISENHFVKQRDVLLSNMDKLQ